MAVYIAPPWVQAELVWRCKSCQASGKPHVITPAALALMTGLGVESLEAQVEQHELFVHGIFPAREVKS